MDKFVIIQWPEIQKLMDRQGFDANAHLINDDSGLVKYGDSAYFVNERWMQSNFFERLV